MNGGERELLPELVVSNAGPLITLATISRLDLLKALFEQIVISQAVHDEVVVHGKGEPGSQKVDEATWITTVQVKHRLAVNLLRETLDAGESEAIVLAQELTARYVLLDDGLARRKAQLIGLRMTGTLGILLMAKEAGLIPAVRLVLDELRQTDFRVSDRVYREVLTRAGEG
jgi:predicted nucleic acid-binding protein